MATRRQHYVWRHYLEAWQAGDGRLSCLVGDKLVRTTPAKVMVERDFYKAQPITSADAIVLRGLLMAKETSPHLRRLHDGLIAYFEYLSHAHEVTRRSPRVSSDEEALVRDVLVEVEERLHGGIEQRAVPVLEALRRKDASVIRSDAAAVPFFEFVSQQYLRTKRMRDRVGKGLAEFLPAGTAARIRHVYCHCIAENLGASLYADRERFELLFVECAPDHRLVTGDQPVVNILGTKDGTAPEEIALYYPLSPALGMILAPRTLDLGSMAADPTATGIVGLNELIVAASPRFLVADSDSLLQAYAA